MRFAGRPRNSYPPSAIFDDNSRSPLRQTSISLRHPFFSALLRFPLDTKRPQSSTSAANVREFSSARHPVSHKYPGVHSNFSSKLRLFWF